MPQQQIHPEPIPSIWHCMIFNVMLSAFLSHTLVLSHFFLCVLHFIYLFIFFFVFCIHGNALLSSVIAATTSSCVFISFIDDDRMHVKAVIVYSTSVYSKSTKRLHLIPSIRLKDSSMRLFFKVANYFISMIKSAYFERGCQQIMKSIYVSTLLTLGYQKIMII